jgi:hypothetical protein
MNSVIKIFNYRFYVKEFLILFFCYLFTEQIFSWIFTPVSMIVQSHLKIVSFIIYGYMLFILPKLPLVERTYVGIVTLLLIRLVFESLFKFGTLFQQLTMFYVLFPVVYTVFIKYLCKTFDLDLLEFVAKFYLVTYLVFMALYGRNFSFSLDVIDMEDYGPFSGDGRTIHASSVLMMIIPFLWYLNKYITAKKPVFLLIFAFCFIVILIHQHRSVWSSAIFSLLIYFSLTMRNNKKTIPRIWSMVFGTFIVAFFAYIFISSLLPGIIDFFGDRFAEIFDPGKEESTGRFRVEQRETYFNLFLQRPFFGWTFEGFEMDNPLVDWWPKNSGQHFHESYMEMLFYQGITGFLVKFSFLFYLIYKAFSKKLTEQTIIILSFCLSGLIFSFSYVLPLIYWGHVGMCLYYLEKDELTSKNPGFKDRKEIYLSNQKLLPNV